MASWDLDLPGIDAVLKNVATPAEALGEALSGLEGAVTAAATAAQSAAIGQALQEYFEQEEGPRIQGMSTRITASTSGVVDAVTAYSEGDLQMAAAHQQAAVEQVYPPTPTYDGSTQFSGPGRGFGPMKAY